MSDRVSKALAEASLPGEPRTNDAISKRSGVPLSTLFYRTHGQRSREEKAEGHQYLTPSEEKTLEKYLKPMADLGNPVRIKYCCMQDAGSGVPYIVLWQVLRRHHVY